MPFFMLIYQLLLLKSLMAFAFENGYNPSAEEFDSFLQEHQNIWPKDLLMRQRQRVWTSRSKNMAYFTPKYKFENQAQFSKRHLNKQQSSLDDQETAAAQHELSAFSNNAKDSVFNNKNTDLSETPNSVLNSTETSLPIFFTNPTTGIDYAIIELGKRPFNQSELFLNDTIPIYITKEQYDRDLFLQRKYYENKCLPKKKNIVDVSKISNTTSSTTTNKPIIIRLQNFTRIPAPVTIRKGINVQDNLLNRTNLKIVKNKRKSTSKRPGRKPTKKPLLLTTTFYPPIILGTKNIVRTTQMEKPTTFSVFSEKENMQESNVRKRRSVTSATQIEHALNNTNGTERTQDKKIHIINYRKGNMKNENLKIAGKSDGKDNSIFNLLYEDIYDSDSDYDKISAKRTRFGLGSESYDDNYAEYKSSMEESAGYGAMDTNDNLKDKINLYSKFKVSKNKKNLRASDVSYEDYEYDDVDGDSYSNIAGFFRMIFYPVQSVIGRIFNHIGSKDVDIAQSANNYPTYTLYGNNPQQLSTEYESAEESNLMNNWLGTWLGMNRRTTKKMSSTTTAMPIKQHESSSSWLGSWFTGESTEENSQETHMSNNWFFGLFGSKPKINRRTTTIPAPTVTSQVPILTIVDPHKNPQNWIGILANHVVNVTPAITQRTPTSTYGQVEQLNKPIVYSYRKYQIWRLKPQTRKQVRILEEYRQDTYVKQIIWLRGPSLRGCSDILISPTILSDFQSILDSESISYETIIFDVEKVISYEKINDRKIIDAAKPQTAMSWDKYYNYEHILTFLESLRLRYSQNIELIHIGRSYEGRPLVITKIFSKQYASKGINNTNYNTLKMKKISEKGKAVFIEAGTHGMEWIGPAAATWIINELLKIMRNNKTVNLEQEHIRNTTWYIMPVLNPDGYVYSHEYDRFWRKTRSRHIYNDNNFLTSAVTWLQQKKLTKKLCFGVDLDKNWSYAWGKRGSSKSPCSEFYAGTQAISEPETKALSNFIQEYRRNIKLYISLQAYGQVIKYPLKSNASYNAEDIEDALDVATVGLDGLRKKGSKTRYRVDLTNDLIEQRSGSADAFASYNANIPFSYTLYLADHGVHGYLLPSSSIEHAARDAFKIIISMFDYIYEF